MTGLLVNRLMLWMLVILLRLQSTMVWECVMISMAVFVHGESFTADMQGLTAS